MDDSGRWDIVYKLLGYTWYTFHNNSPQQFFSIFVVQVFLPDDALIVRNINIEKNLYCETNNRRIPGVGSSVFLRAFRSRRSVKTSKLMPTFISWLQDSCPLWCSPAGGSPPIKCHRVASGAAFGLRCDGVHKLRGPFKNWQKAKPPLNKDLLETGVVSIREREGAPGALLKNRPFCGPNKTPNLFSLQIWFPGKNVLWQLTVFPMKTFRHNTHSPPPNETW